MGIEGIGTTCFYKSETRNRNLLLCQKLRYIMKKADVTVRYGMVTGIFILNYWGNHADKRGGTTGR